MRFGIVVFPGTWSDGDCYHAVKSVLGQEARYVWHKDRDLSGLDCLILPGGFSYGDYLRTGAIARFSPVMEELERFAGRGGLVLGICNGFQILCEAGLLPGVLMRNHHVQFRCQWVDLRVENTDTPFTSQCQAGSDAAHTHLPRGGQLLRRPGHPGLSQRRWADCVPVLHTPR